MALRRARVAEPLEPITAAFFETFTGASDRISGTTPPRAHPARRVPTLPPTDSGVPLSMEAMVSRGASTAALARVGARGKTKNGRVSARAHASAAARGVSRVAPAPTRARAPASIRLARAAPPAAAFARALRVTTTPSPAPQPPPSLATPSTTTTPPSPGRSVASAPRLPPRRQSAIPPSRTSTPRSRPQVPQVRRRHLQVHHRPHPDHPPGRRRRLRIPG